MASRATSIILDIIGKDNASHAFNKVGESAEHAHGSMSKLALGAGAAAVAVAVGAGAIAKSSIDAAMDVGKQTLQLQRLIGGSAESVSRLRFSAEASGVSFESLAKSTGKFEKALGTAGAAGKAHDAMVKELGFSYTDATGKILPVDGLMLKVADKFHGMSAGAEKTALAMKLFGKAGADMLPMLNKGSEALRELMQESDKYGYTLTGKNLDAVKTAIVHHRQFDESVGGLKVQIGLQLLPVMTKMTDFIRDQVIPVIKNVGDWMGKHKEVVQYAAIAIGVFTVAMTALNIVMALNPISLVVIGLSALAVGLIYAYKHSETFRNIVNEAFHVIGVTAQWLWGNVLSPLFTIWKAEFVAIATVGTWLWQNALKPAFEGIGAAGSFMWNNVLKPVFKFIVDTFLGVVGTIIDGAAQAFGWVPGLGGKLKDAAHVFDHFREQVNNTLDGVHQMPDVTANARVGMQQFLNQFMQLGTVIPGIKGLNPAGLVPIGGARAAGGPVAAGTPYLVGENGPELFMPTNSGTVVPNHALSGGISITVNGALDPVGTARQIQQMLTQLKRLNGGLELGLT